MSNIVIISFIVLFAFVSIPVVYGLESDSEYFLESENIFLIVAVDTDNNAKIADVGITINDDGTALLADMDNVKLHRTYDNGDAGRIFGLLEDGSHYYLRYFVSENNNDVKIMAKIWHAADDTKTRIIENGNAYPLF